MTIVAVVLGVLFMVAMCRVARCPTCGFYRDPESVGCNCPSEEDE